jgi:hypothetical protein
LAAGPSSPYGEGVVRAQGPGDTSEALPDIPGVPGIRWNQLGTSADLFDVGNLRPQFGLARNTQIVLNDQRRAPAIPMKEET